MQRSDFEAFREQVLTNKQLAAQALRQVVLQWRPELRATPLDEFPAIAEATWTRVTGRPVPDTPLAWEKLAARVRAPIPDELNQATLHRLAHLVADYYAEEAGETWQLVASGPIDDLFKSDAEPSPLNETERDAAAYIDAHPGAYGKQVAEEAGVTCEHFRKRVVPRLKQHGYHQKDGRKGYWPPDR